MESKVEITLVSPLEIAEKGEFVMVSEVTLVAPPGKNLKLVSKVQTALGSILMIISGMSSKSDGKPEAESSGMTSADVVGILIFAGPNIERLDDAICKLLTSGGCIVGEGQMLTMGMLEDAPVTIYHQLRAEYIANFMASSLGGATGPKG